MKHLLSTLCILLSPFILSGQYTIDFEDMELGPVSTQSTHIKLWEPPDWEDEYVPSDPVVTDERSYSGTKSLFISGNQTDDVIFKLGDKSLGIWTVSFKLYIPSGHNGYFNIQGYEDHISYNGDFYLGAYNEEIEPGKFFYTVDSSEFNDTSIYATTFPYDEWFTVKMLINQNNNNVDSSTISTWVNDKLFMDEFPYLQSIGIPAFSLGGINFYSLYSTNEMFIDDFVLKSGTVSTTDISVDTRLKVFPNPATEQFMIQEDEIIRAVKLYNSQGIEVMQSHPGMRHPVINVGKLKAGIYHVQVLTASGTSKTARIVVQ